MFVKFLPESLYYFYFVQHSCQHEDQDEWPVLDELKENHASS